MKVSTGWSIGQNDGVFGAFIAETFYISTTILIKWCSILKKRCRICRKIEKQGCLKSALMIVYSCKVTRQPFTEMASRIVANTFM